MIEGICTRRGCGEVHHAKGRCYRHYAEYRKFLAKRRRKQTRPARRCSYRRCPRTDIVLRHPMSLCRLHWHRWNRYGDPGKTLHHPPTTDAAKKRMSRLCDIPDCGEKHYGRGWCKLHYDRWRRHGDPMMVLPSPDNLPHRPRSICEVKDCGEFLVGRGLCKAHYQRLMLKGDVRPDQRVRGRGLCITEGCGRRAGSSLGHCAKCHAKWRRAQGIEPPVHGLSGYTNYACRCVTCKSAQQSWYYG